MVYVSVVKGIAHTLTEILSALFLFSDFYVVFPV